jgi:putative CocE/NonD family hydrolase
MSFVHRLMLKRMGLVATHKVRIKSDVKVRMPDGVELLTDVYFGSTDASAPTIMIRSPYGKGAFIAGSTAYPLASQGFNVVLQCCRGTHGSSGTFDPHHDEQRDGLATLEWIRQQPWCNGVLATHGGSYLGYTQWAIAAVAGSDVKAMAMQITLSDFSQMTYAGNSFMLQNAFSWSHTMLSAKKSFAFLRMLLLRMRNIPAISEAHWMFLPLGKLDEHVSGERIPFWKDWTRHASKDDPWWSPMSHHKSISQIKRPITMLAGWFDIFTPWQLHDFIALQQAGCESRITIGPWQHTDAQAVGVGLQDAIEWFNRHLLGQETVTKRKAVKLFVMGADEWREYDAWPPRESNAENWYLRPERRLLNQIAPDSPADQFVYDPANPTPSIGGPALESKSPSVDNAELEARSDVLTYTSEPFERSRDIIGTVTADLYVSSSAPSADFFVRVCDVDNAGVSMNICDGLQRVKLEASGPERVHVELWPTAYRVPHGHRIRVQISSGAFPRWARNLGTTDPLADATELRTARQSIYHSAAHPSAIKIPFCGN